MPDIDEQRAQWREEASLTGRIGEDIDSQLWGNGYGDCKPSGFESEDPTLCGRPEDGSDGMGVVLVRRADGVRFLVDVQVFVQRLKPLEEDPDYIAEQQRIAEEAEEAGPVPVVDPNQLILGG